MKQVFNIFKQDANILIDPQSVHCNSVGKEREGESIASMTVERDLSDLLFLTS